MSLEDELKIQNLKKELNLKEDSILELKERISEMMSKINEAQNAKIKVEGDLRAQLAEAKYLEIKVKNTEILEDRINNLTTEKKGLEKQLLEYRKKNEDLLKEREVILNEKAAILESKNNILQKNSDLQLQIQERDLKFADFQIKYKEISSENLTREMDLDKAKQKLKALKNENKVLTKKIEEFTGDEEETERTEPMEELFDLKQVEGTGVISNSDTLTNFLKSSIKQARSNIRLILPEIHDIEKLGVLDVLNGIPKNVKVNIAGNIEDAYGDDLVRELKKIYQLTNYKGENIFALNVDSSKIGLGTIKGNKTIGIFTDSIPLIDLIKSTIMAPFLKGRKIM